MTRYRVTGIYEWYEVIRFSHVKRIDAVVEAESEDEAVDRAVEESNINYGRDGEFDGDDSRALFVEILPPPTPEELEAEERNHNHVMMQSLGVPTLFDVR